MHAQLEGNEFCEKHEEILEKIRKIKNTIKAACECKRIFFFYEFNCYRLKTTPRETNATIISPILAKLISVLMILRSLWCSYDLITSPTYSNLFSRSTRVIFPTL